MANRLLASGCQRTRWRLTVAMTSTVSVAKKRRHQAISKEEIVSATRVRTGLVENRSTADAASAYPRCLVCPSSGAGAIG